MMKKYAWSLLPTLLLLAGAGTVLAAGRAVADATVPFGFSVAGTPVPAGKYEILVEDPTFGTLMLRKLDSGKPILVGFTTRLAKREGDENTLVFDKVGDKYYLSEIHLSAYDGYLVPGAPGQHTHTQVKAYKKKS
jgi:hypothetical protein